MSAGCTAGQSPVRAMDGRIVRCGCHWLMPVSCQGLLSNAMSDYSFAFLKVHVRHWIISVISRLSGSLMVNVKAAGATSSRVCYLITLGIELANRLDAPAVSTSCCWCTEDVRLSLYISQLEAAGVCNNRICAICLQDKCLTFINNKVVFTAPCYSNGAVLPSYGVCPSVCPSVTLVSADHIRWARWNFITRLVSTMSSLAVRKISAI